MQLALESQLKLNIEIRQTDADAILQTALGNKQSRKNWKFTKIISA